MARSQAYLQQLQQGPFANRMDPWAENGRYFHQIHAGIITAIIDQIQQPLLERGYIVGRETSLQVLQGRQPDIFVQYQDEPPPPTTSAWQYSQAAVTIGADPGLAVEHDAPDLHGIHIKRLHDGQLVTVVEVISPRNKADINDIEAYQQRRAIQIQQHINIVEIDLTRSIKRLLDSTVVHAFHYHVAIYIPAQAPRLIGYQYNEPLKRLALPLHEDVVPVALQAAYDYAYRAVHIAAHINGERRYHAASLPFPTTLTPEERADAMQRVQQWQTQLAELSQTNNP